MQASDQVILILLVPEELKDKAVDFLICEPELSGFNVSKIQGFSKKNSQFNIKEQVEGYKDLYRFEIIYDAVLMHKLVSGIKLLLGEDHYRYWLTQALQLDESARV